MAPNSVVLKNIESNSIVGGIPAKFIRFKRIGELL
jgi:acetyltransferase-like isoleucine patch superfamily enzyme